MRITDALDQHAAQRPTALAVADGTARLSWGDLRTAVDALAATLTSQGLQVGDRIAVYGHDGAATLVAALAVLRAGGVHAPVDHTLTEPEIAALITALGTPWRLDVPKGASVEVALSLVATGQARTPDPLGSGVSAFLRLSSGTTGAAKGVLISHASLCDRVLAANRGLQLGPDDRVLWLLPMAYHFAVSILNYLHHGTAIVFGNALRATGTATIAREHHVTFAYGSPWHIRRLAELPVGHDLPATLTRVVSTTTALDATAAADFRTRHGRGVQQGLGIIEVGLPFLSPGAAGERPGDLGVPLPDYRIDLLDEHGEPTAGPGELAIAGPGLFDAYLTPWRPRDTVLHRGFFRTGDRAERTADGGIRLLGRLKDVINVGGVKVFPQEVESVLDAHPWVVASRVRSAPDARLGEQVHAEVQLKPGHDVATVHDELSTWCAERLAPLKRPAAYTVVERLAMTASGKVIR
ncbi:MAG: acyl--CoA ligase [Planctomycetes bacterium]|nr:acyl--CoA ligase [Planctomycetota bacterium]